MAVLKSWSGTGEAYRRSFAGVCAGPMERMLGDLAAAPGRRLLDVGCGTGTLARSAADQGWRVTGVDAAPDMVAMTLAEVDGAASVLQASVPHLPFPDSCFDAVVANFVVNHLPDPRGGVCELARLLAPGGLLAVTTWTSRPSVQAQLFADALAAAGAVTPPGTRLAPELDFDRSGPGLAALVAEAGLEPVVVEELTWDWRISWDDLWAGISGGVATIGATYLAQDEPVRQRVRNELRERSRALEVDGIIRFPSIAPYVVARA